MRSRLGMKMQMRLGPQLILAGELLRASGIELELRIQQELDENPALEITREHLDTVKPFKEIYPSDLGAIGSSQSWTVQTAYEGCQVGSEFENPIERQAFRQPALIQLAAQASLLVEGDDLEKVIILLQSLDERGYLHTSTEELTDLLETGAEELERLSLVLQNLEPPGIGARDLRECLLIQCRFLEAEAVDCSQVRFILEQAWEDFSALRWERVAKKLGISLASVEEIRRFIATNLYPYPLALVKDDSNTSEGLYIPDLIVRRQIREGDLAYILEIPAANAIKLHLSETFTTAIEQKYHGWCDFSEQEKIWLQARLERARVFIASLEQRWDTLRRIGEFLIDYQKDYLEGGPSYLRPLTQEIVAAALGCHKSTVSRAVQEKIIQLPGGRLVLLANFFDDSLAVKAVIRNILVNTPQSLSDREVAERLSVSGYQVARRTVAKYRSQLHQSYLEA